MSSMENLMENLSSLIDSIKSKKQLDDIIKDQQKFSNAVEEAMNYFQKGNIKVEVSEALPIVMYNWAVYELPSLIQSQENHLKIKNQLVLFQNTIEKILNPKEFE